MLYPPILARIYINKKPTDSIVFKHPCKDCGKPNAPFGKGANVNKFLATHAKGNPDYKLLGEWTCGLNGCKNV